MSVSLNNCGVCWFCGDCNGSVKGVSSGTADGTFDGAFGDSKDTAEGFRGVSNKSNGVFSPQLLNCRLVCIRNMNRFHNGVYYKSFAVY